MAIDKIYTHIISIITILDARVRMKVIISRIDMKSSNR